MTGRFHIFFLFALSLAIYAGTAATPALMDDADGGYAIAAREMLERGDFVVNLRREASLRVPPDASYVVAESGGRALYVNCPLAPGQASLGQLRSQM